MANNFTEQESQPVQLSDDEKLLVREAVSRYQNILNIDSAQELRKFKQMITWRQRRRRLIWATAASITIILGVAGSIFLSGLNPFKDDAIIVYEANDSISEVMLYAQGKCINLQSDSANSAVHAVGASVCDNLLKYSQESDVHSNTLSIPNGRTFCVTLSDGTVVWLNSHSRLTYPSTFTGSERKVQLTGEAYFKVSKDAAHPFIVECNGVRTKVLGTEFNVRQYDSEPADITLVEGSVEVHMQKHRPVRLLPGQNINVQANGRISVENVDIREYTEWKSGFFYFDNKTLTEVFYIIGRYYNVSVLCSNPKTMSTHFNLWIDMKKPLEENLKLINEVGELHAYMLDNKVIIK